MCGFVLRAFFRSYLFRVPKGGDEFDQELWNVFEEEEHHEPLAKVDLFHGVVVDLGMSGAGIRLERHSPSRKPPIWEAAQASSIIISALIHHARCGR